MRMTKQAIESLREFHTSEEIEKLLADRKAKLEALYENSEAMQEEFFSNLFAKLKEVANKHLERVQVETSRSKGRAARIRKFQGFYDTKIEQISELSDSLNNFKSNPSEYFRFQLVETVLKIESSSIDRIVQNVSRPVESVISWEDIKQIIWTQLIEKPERMDFAFFYATIKRLAVDAVRTEMNRYRKYSKVYISDNVKLINQLTNMACKMDTSRLHITEIIDTFQGGLSPIEKDVFKAHFLLGYSMRDVDKVLGQRCDRIKTRVYEKLVAYFMEQSDENKLYAPYDKPRKVAKLEIGINHNRKVFASNRIHEFKGDSRLSSVAKVIEYNETVSRPIVNHSTNETAVITIRAVGKHVGNIVTKVLATEAGRVISAYRAQFDQVTYTTN